MIQVYCYGVQINIMFVIKHEYTRGTTNID
jgi:hypothetical protein